MVFQLQQPNMSTASVFYESDTNTPRHLTPALVARFKPASKPLALPPKSSLRLAPKLLLQIQQLAPNHRPQPVFGVWQPPFLKSKLTRDFVHRPKLRTGDVYATLDEPFIINSHLRKQSTKSDDPEHTPTRDITAAMCQSTNPDTPSSSSIYFRDAQCSWSARASMAGPNHDIPSYRFTLQDEKSSESDSQIGRIILQWEKRELPKNSNQKQNQGESQNTDQFVLMLIDRQARRKSRIATMTPGGLEVFVRKSSILESLRVCFNLTSPSATVTSGRDPHEVLESWLYTHVLTLGVWVASQEGWLG
ncbi:hypothetical protein N7509_013537 [Penicillium cosmopolitanum]|uniref:Uncharacterized protein n=1 Tax=Penicillium cosmopolitanum TaxID=1131564 RepID=A0A9W9SDJ6_9EURO|nr:uncharacterized protein N7509_013537 [Penicillium cosmopolitanum]KAJ5376651.1 hypothetical protein N7509_013537 [Penicillium cosmopolitanum]